jgi:uncharacterized membrane protein YheB (UPF0754 family)
MADNPDDVFCIYAHMELEEKFQLIVGHVHCLVHIREREFHDKLKNIEVLLNTKQAGFESFNMASAVQMFIGQSFRQARLATEIFKNAQEYSDDGSLFDLLSISERTVSNLVEAS